MKVRTLKRQDLTHYVSSNKLGEFHRSIEATINGRPIIVETPLGKRYHAQNLVDEWLSVLHKNLQDPLFQGLLKYEEEMASKVGPMSYQKPLVDRREDIESYYTSINRVGIDVPVEALECVAQEWHLSHRLRLKSARATWNDMKKSTSTGLPWLGKRRVNEDKIVNSEAYMLNEDDISIYGLDAESNQKREFKAAALLGWRGQEGGPQIDDIKQRVIFMFPASVNLHELRVYQVLKAYLQSNNRVPGWIGNDAVDRTITELFKTKGDNELIVCTDFTKFDQHFNQHCQRGAEYLLRRAFQNDAVHSEWFRSVFPIKFNIPLIAGKSLYQGPHGMGSGSGGTNDDETILHRALQHEASLSKGSVLNLNSMCLGDDGIISYPGCNARDITEIYTQHGLDMNESKQSESVSECIYLRRWHHRDYIVDDINVGVYPTMRALGRLCYQERFYDSKIWDEKMVALRYLSILENIRYHPLREEFVDFIIARDKYRLGIDIPGFLASVTELAKKSNDAINDFLGYVQTQELEGSGGYSSINNWWIVNYLKSKS